MPPVLTDPVYLCARAYQDMIDAEIAFKTEIIIGSKVKEIEIKPLDSEFKHMSGIHHLNDLQHKLQDIEKIGSGIILSDLLSGELSNSDLSKSIHFNDISKGGFQFQDRISILTNYQQIMESIVSSGTLKTFRWERDVPSDSRPYGSNISADYLFQFQIKGSPYPYMNFFFKDEGNGHLAGISCFPSTQDYSFEKRTMKDGKIQMYGLSEAKVLTITETSRDNPDVPLKTISAEERKAVQERLDAELYTDFAKKLTLELVKEIRKEKDISRRIDNFTENKNGKFPDAVLKMMNSRLQTFVGAEKKTVSEQICECTEQIDSILKLRQIIKDLPVLREKAYHSEEEMNQYLETSEKFTDKLDNIYKCEYALKELKKQYDDISADSTMTKEEKSDILENISSELNEVKAKWDIFNKMETEPRSMDIVFSINAPKLQNNMTVIMEQKKAASIRIPLPPKKPFRALLQKLQQFGTYLKEKIFDMFQNKADDTETDSDSMKGQAEFSEQQKPAPKHENTNQSYFLECERTFPVEFTENAGYCIETHTDYYNVSPALSVTESIIRDVIGKQAERQMPQEKEVKVMEQAYQEQESSSAVKRKLDEYER